MRSQFSQLFARNRAILLNKTAGRWEKIVTGNKKKGGLDKLRISELIEEVSHKWGEGYAKLCKFPWLLSPVVLESNNAQHTQ